MEELDELVLLPLGIVLAIKMVPPNVMAECRARALANAARGTGAGRIGAAVIVLLWLTLAILAAIWAHNAFAHHHGKTMTPNLSLNPDASPEALARRPLGAG